MFKDILGTTEPSTNSSAGALWYLGQEDHPAGTKVTFITNGKADISFDEITRQVRAMIDSWEMK